MADIASVLRHVRTNCQDGRSCCAKLEPFGRLGWVSCLPPSKSPVVLGAYPFRLPASPPSAASASEVSPEVGSAVLRLSRPRTGPSGWSNTKEVLLNVGSSEGVAGNAGKGVLGNPTRSRAQGRMSSSFKHLALALSKIRSRLSGKNSRRR